MKRLKSLTLVSAFFAFCFGLLSVSSVYADENQSLSVSVGISPAVQRTELDPGAVYHNNVTIQNSSNHPFKVHMSAEPYSVEDITYSPIYSVKNAYTQIANWITFDVNDFEIEPYHSYVVSYTVRVPNDAPGGGQYAAIFAEAEEISSADSVQAKASPGMVLIARVSGETRLTGEIVKTSIPGFLLSPPVSATATFKNTGNVDVDAKMVVKVENYFTGESIYDGSSDPLEKTILPGTTRDLNFSWSNVPRLGILKVTLNTDYLSDAEVKTRIVVICPIWFIALIVVIILLVIFRVLSKKRENRQTRANSKDARGASQGFKL